MVYGSDETGLKRVPWGSIKVFHIMDDIVLINGSSSGSASVVEPSPFLSLRGVGCWAIMMLDFHLQYFL